MDENAKMWHFVRFSKKVLQLYASFRVRLTFIVQCGMKNMSGLQICSIFAVSIE